MPERNIPRYVVFLTALFFAAFLTGFLAPIPGKLDLLGTLKDAFEPFLTLPPWKMFFVILLNNSAKSFAILLSGILFGLVPLVAVATNGYVLGVAYLFASGKVGYVQAAKAVLPHGVLEIPAVIIRSVLRSMAWRNFRQANPAAEHSGVRQSGHSWDQDVLQNCFPAVHPCRPHRDVADLFDRGRDLYVKQIIVTSDSTACHPA